MVTQYSQATKDYAGDWAKAKSRVLHKEMLDRTLLKFRKPKDIKVLFFPGVDATEVHEVYDPLGIPRENLLGIERDREVYEHLKGQDLGIQLVRGSLEGYVELEERFDFDDISVDYVGSITRTQELTLRKILGNSSKNHLVLNCVNSITRDHLSRDMYLCGIGASDDIEFHENLGYDDIIKMRAEGGAKKIWDMEDQLENGCDKDLKGLAYSTALSMIYFDPGFTENTFNRALKFTSGSEYLDILKLLEKNVAKEGFKIDSDEPVDSLMRLGVNPSSLIGTIEGIINSNIRCECEDYGIDNNRVVSGLNLAVDVALRDDKFFWEKDIDPYSYVSESGTPMIGNVVFLSYPERVHNVSRRIVNELGYPDRFEIKDLRSMQKLLRKNSSELIRFRTVEEIKIIHDKKLEREFLGNSSKPVLTKQRAIEEFRLGSSVEDVRSRYRNIGNKPLAQWKSHVTMGTYDENSKENEEVVVFEEDSDLERITKEEAIDLLASGIPTDEVHSAYPTSFSVRQLSAFKAHVTMGTYSK